MKMEDQEKFDMGHSRYAGRVTEQAVGGCNFVRVDVPAFEGSPAFTKLLGQSSIFAITPVTEQVAKGMAQQFRNQPVSVYDLPESFRQRQLPASVGTDERDYLDRDEEEGF